MKFVALPLLYLFYVYLYRCIKNSAVFRSRILNYQDIYKSVIKAKCFDFGIVPQTNIQGKRLMTENSKHFFKAFYAISAIVSVSHGSVVSSQ